VFPDLVETLALNSLFSAFSFSGSGERTAKVRVDVQMIG
jgi:hypothetical protein